MRKSAVTLRIPEPCAQPWAEMMPQGAGRHCAACQKVVIDFTQKTGAEILAVLSAYSGQACGRFGASQLDRPLQMPLAPRPAWWQTAVAATVALLGFRGLASNGAQAQQRVRYHPEVSSARSRVEPAGQAHSSSKEVAGQAPTNADSMVLTGRVLDKQSGEGLPGVTILLEGTTHGVSTSSDGTFSLQVLPEDRHRQLEFSSIGYVRQTLPQPQASQVLLAQMEVDVKGMMSGVVVTVGNFYAPIYTPQGIWQRLRSIPGRMRYALRRD